MYVVIVVADDIYYEYVEYGDICKTTESAISDTINLIREILDTFSLVYIYSLVDSQIKKKTNR